MTAPEVPAGNQLERLIAQLSTLRKEMLTLEDSMSLKGVIYTNITEKARGTSSTIWRCGVTTSDRFSRASRHMGSLP
jgi:hypothetical protein